MTRYLLAVSAAAVLAAFPASAQDTGNAQTGTTTQQQSAGAGGGIQGMQGMPAGDVTCREITAMDTQTVAGVLYFISGYTNAQRDAGMPGGDQSAGAMPSGQSGQSGQTGQSGTDAGATGATGGADTTAGTGGTAGTGDAGSTTADAGASGQAGATPQIAAMRGFFEIPVEQTIVACQAEPEARAGDVIERQRGAGMGSGSGSTNQ